VCCPPPDTQKACSTCGPVWCGVVRSSLVWGGLKRSPPPFPKKNQKKTCMLQIKDHRAHPPTNGVSTPVPTIPRNPPPKKSSDSSDPCRTEGCPVSRQQQGRPIGKKNALSQAVLTLHDLKSCSRWSGWWSGWWGWVMWFLHHWAFLALERVDSYISRENI